MLGRLLDVIGAWVGTSLLALSTILFGPTTTAPVSLPPSPLVAINTRTAVTIETPKIEPVKIVPVSSPAPTMQVTSTPQKKTISVPQATPLPPPSLPAPVPANKAVATTAPSDIPSNEGGALTPTDIFMLTNAERTKEGLSKLTYNKRLAAIAEAKAMDMITQQYFEHKSPQGIDVSGLAEKYGYAYSYIGENLALGDFASSSHVVDGWMKSPGHRANILNTHYAEIGVGAIMGKWEGREVWFAVQEFGTPLPDCTKPDSFLYSKINIFQTQIEAMESTLRRLKQEIDAGAGTPQEQAQKVDDYNRIVEGYNKLIATERAFLSEYNMEVKAYNTCMGV